VALWALGYVCAYVRVRVRKWGCGSGSSLTEYDELAYPFSKIIKLKHEPEEAQENKPVQYTADIIVEIKIEMAQWYP
jgi:hypothetical protein